MVSGLNERYENDCSFAYFPSASCCTEISTGHMWVVVFLMEAVIVCGVMACGMESDIFYVRLHTERHLNAH